jgi:hypothetical protein
LVYRPFLCKRAQVGDKIQQSKGKRATFL